jgi:hypothetical protein
MSLLATHAEACAVTAHLYIGQSTLRSNRMFECADLLVYVPLVAVFS